MTVQRPTAGDAIRVVPSRMSRTGETLRLIRAMGQASVSDLAEAMGVARSTVVERLDRLRTQGLVTSVGERTPMGRGRPAALYEFRAAAGVLLTCHVGMTGTRVGLTDLAGSVMSHRLVELDIELGPEPVLDVVEETMHHLLQQTGAPDIEIYGIGVGLPGAVELSSTRVSRQPWTSYPIAARLSERFGAPSFVDQDVNLLALGEQTAAWPDSSVVLCVKVGTVIGCGIVIDGRIVGGTDGLAGEIGHSRIAGREDVCACGNRGCLNAVAGGRALARDLATQGFATVHARDVVALAREGVPAAQLAIRQAGRDIGTVLAGAVNLLNPHVIALWGYLLEAKRPLVAGIRETLYQQATPSATHDLQLVSAELGATTGLRGAAIMVAEQVLSPEEIDRRLEKSSRA